MIEYIVDFPNNKILDLVMRERIVRCRDCRFYLPDMYKHFTCEYLQHWVKPDCFCAWGERKERIES